MWQAKVYKNTSTAIFIAEAFANNGFYTSAAGSGVAYLDANDTIHLSVFHSSGSANEDIQGHQAVTYLNIYRIA